MEVLFRRRATPQNALIILIEQCPTAREEDIWITVILHLAHLEWTPVPPSCGRSYIASIKLTRGNFGQLAKLKIIHLHDSIQAT